MCSRAVLDYLSSTDIGRRVPAEEDDAVSAVSELEVREWMEEQATAPERRPAAGLGACGKQVSRPVSAKAKRFSRTMGLRAELCCR